MPSSPRTPEDRFQREIDDIVRLAERRLERQEGLGGRARRSTRSLGRSVSGLGFRLPPVEQLAGWGLALMLLSWLIGLLGFFPGAGLASFATQVVGIGLLTLAIVLSLLRGRAQGTSSREKVWRGERLTYGNPYGESTFARRIRRFFRGR